MHLKHLMAVCLLLNPLSSLLASNLEDPLGDSGKSPRERIEHENPFEDLDHMWLTGAVYYDPNYARYEGQTLYLIDAKIPAARIDNFGYIHLNGFVFGDCKEWHQEQARQHATSKFREENANILALIRQLTCNNSGSIERAYVSFALKDGVDFANAWVGYVLYAIYGDDAFLAQIFGTIPSAHRADIFDQVCFAVTPAMPSISLFEYMPLYQDERSSYAAFEQMKERFLENTPLPGENFESLLEGFVREKNL